MSHLSTIGPAIALRRRAASHEACSSARLLAPQHLVQLQLEADRQPIVEHPLREGRRRQLSMRRREQHFTEFVEPVLAMAERALERDRTKTRVTEISKLGLVEMTRQRVRGFYHCAQI